MEIVPELEGLSQLLWVNNLEPGTKPGANPRPILQNMTIVVDLGMVVEGCPVNSSSPPGSMKVTDCSCNSGYEGPARGPCLLCPENAYCFDGKRTACPDHAVAPLGSGDKAACVCVPTFFGTNGGTCRICPVDYFCPGGEEAILCPNNMASERGISSVLMCGAPCFSQSIPISPSCGNLPPVE
eukprot:3487268-Rhodomonas_salina.1